MLEARHQGAMPQRTFTSSDKSLVVVLTSEDRLLIQTIEGACSTLLTEVDTLRLANLLKVNYADIAQAALPFTGVQTPGKKRTI